MEDVKETLAPGCLTTYMTLSPELQTFVKVYALDSRRNATRAYLAARPDVTPAAAMSSASRLLRSAKVRAAVGEVIAANMDVDDIRDRSIAELRAMAFDGSCRVLSPAADDAPYLPGMEPYMRVACKPADKLAAIKTLLAIAGYKTEGLDITLRQGETSDAAAQLLAELRAERDSASGHQIGYDEPKTAE